VFTDINGNVLSEKFTDKETDLDTESETSEDQQLTGVGAYMAIDQESANTVDNNQIMYYTTASFSAILYIMIIISLKSRFNKMLI